MFAAIFTIFCGTSVFTSCNKSDNPVVPVENTEGPDGGNGQD